MIEPVHSGQKLNAIYFDEQCRMIVGEHGCKSITVVMENGQMAGVPWAETDKNGEIQRWNLANVHGIKLDTTQ